MPETIVYRSVRDTHNAKGVVAVQLEPKSTLFNLEQINRKKLLCFEMLLSTANDFLR